MSSKVKKFTKKQVNRMEIGSFVFFFILGWVLPENIMQYPWAQSFTGVMASVFPMVDNFANNPQFPGFFTFYYAALCVPMVVFVVIYFFSEKLVFVVNEERRNKIFNNSSYLRAILLIIMCLLFLALVVIMISDLGTSVSSHNPYGFMFKSKIGATITGNLFFSLMFSKIIFTLFSIYGINKEGLPSRKHSK